MGVSLTNTMDSETHYILWVFPTLPHNLKQCTTFKHEQHWSTYCASLVSLVSEEKKSMRPSVRVSCWSAPAGCSEPNSKTFHASSTLYLAVPFCKYQKGYKHHDWNDTMPTVQNAFQPIPGLISCAGVTRRWGSLGTRPSHAEEG